MGVTPMMRVVSPATRGVTPMLRVVSPATRDGLNDDARRLSGYPGRLILPVSLLVLPKRDLKKEQKRAVLIRNDGFEHSCMFRV